MIKAPSLQETIGQEADKIGTEAHTSLYVLLLFLCDAEDLFGCGLPFDHLLRTVLDQRTHT